jgi:hypothetical protein
VTALRFAGLGWLVLGAALVGLSSLGAFARVHAAEAPPRAAGGALEATPGAGAAASPRPADAWGAPLVAGAVLVGVVLNVFAVARGRPLRDADRRARLGYRLGVLALALFLGAPLAFGALVTARLGAPGMVRPPGAASP